MKRLAFVLAAAGCLSSGGAETALAQYSKSLGPPEVAVPVSYVPRAAFYAGVGAGFNSVNFSNQNIFAQGVSDIFQNGVLVASGQAGGPTDPTLNSQTGFSPTVQAGYYQHFSGNWLWGAKFSYSSLGITSTDQNVAVPQAGSFTSATPATFTGNVVVRSFQNTINHQLTFIPFVGHSFERSFFYIGAGPSLSQTRTKLNGVIGFADLNGQHANITGTPSNFSSTQWALGGAATVGMTYFLDRSWFIDLSYTYSMTENLTENFSAPFASSSLGYDDTGVLSGNYSGRVITQSVHVSINKAF
jgi:opacity protein-like surface antigen